MCFLQNIFYLQKKKSFYTKQKFYAENKTITEENFFSEKNFYTENISVTNKNIYLFGSYNQSGKEKF